MAAAVVLMTAAGAGAAVFLFDRGDDVAESGSTAFLSGSGTGLPESHVGEIRLVSVASDGTSGDNFSGGGVWSPDGARIAFESEATNLVPGDSNSSADVFVKDLRSEELTLVSTNVDGQQGDGYSYVDSWSPDGSRIAITSVAMNLVQGDVNEGQDVFVKDLRSGEVTLVNANADGVPGDGSSGAGSWSPDGTRIVFWSEATNLVSGDENGVADVYVKDLRSGAVTIVSTSPDGTQGDGESFSGSWSPDGTRIAFESEATNLVPGDSNSRADVFVKDLRSGAVTMVSIGQDGAQGDGMSADPSWSPDGTRVAFFSYATNLVHDDTNGWGDVFVKDIRSGAVTMISAGAGGRPGNGSSRGLWSPDGTRIAFWSDAPSVLPGDTNAVGDVFVKDLRSGAVTIVSTAMDGSQGNDYSLVRSWSPDGTMIAFASLATNLVPDDTNGERDVFIKTVR